MNTTRCQARGTFGLLQEEGHDDPSAEMVVNLQEMWKNAGATTQTGPNEDAPNAKDKAAAQETAPDGENDEAEAGAKDADAVDGEDEEVEEEEKMAIEVGEWEIHPQVWTFSCPLDEVRVLCSKLVGSMSYIGFQHCVEADSFFKLLLVLDSRVLCERQLVLVPVHDDAERLVRLAVCIRRTPTCLFVPDAH